MYRNVCLKVSDCITGKSFMTFFKKVLNERNKKIYISFDMNHTKSFFFICSFGPALSQNCVTLEVNNL